MLLFEAVPEEPLSEGWGPARAEGRWRRRSSRRVRRKRSSGRMKRKRSGRHGAWPTMVG